MIHLNIGLETNDGRPVNPLTVMARFVPGLDSLADCRIVESDTEPALVLSFHRLESIRPHDLAVEFGQDCIAVYDDETTTASLQGPGAAKWGAFDAQLFFMPDGRRLAAHWFDAGLLGEPQHADIYGAGY